MTISEVVQNGLFEGNSDDQQQLIRIPIRADETSGSNRRRRSRRQDPPSERSRQLWTTDEHERFLEALELYPSGPWKIIADHVGTRTTRQTMTHAQKYRQKIERRKLKEGRDKPMDDPPFDATEHAVLLEFLDNFHPSDIDDEPLPYIQDSDYLLEWIVGLHDGGVSLTGSLGKRDAYHTSLILKFDIQSTKQHLNMAISDVVQSGLFKGNSKDQQQLIRIPTRAAENCRSKRRSRRQDPPSKRSRLLWTIDEHDRFLEALELYPSGPWKTIADHIGTRTARQTMTHAQKYRQKIERRKRKDNGYSLNVCSFSEDGTSSESGSEKEAAFNDTTEWTVLMEFLKSFQTSEIEVTSYSLSQEVFVLA
ncbi:Myb domain-contaning protein [Phytophthora palmivora]|uniref:Myb domain-contaning protein n=1 Tax=Phytophthora palmivora TaxID=4796 RepID=A0A2P4X593_9STRA|nr:Myb domain-contaning protein [Phytophthora palmivora]